MDSCGDAQEVQFVAPPSSGDFVVLGNSDNQDFTLDPTLLPYYYLNSFEEGCYNSPSTWPTEAFTFGPFGPFGPDDISPYNRNSWDYDNFVTNEQQECQPESSEIIEACTHSRLKHSIDNSDRQLPAETADRIYRETDEDINYRFLKEDLPNLFCQLDSFFIHRHHVNADCLFFNAVMSIFRSGPREGRHFFSMDDPYIYRLVCTLYGMLVYLRSIILEKGLEEQFFEEVVDKLASQRQSRP